MRLRNQEIWLAYSNLGKLASLNLPVKTSLAIGILMSKLKQPYLVIEGERNKLVAKYGKLDPGAKQITVDLQGENAGDFAREFAEILIQEWPDDLEFEKIKLPEKVVSVCEECNHKMEIPLLVEANTLMPLEGDFLEKVS